jgi:signal transduction histidine kinase
MVIDSRGARVNLNKLRLKWKIFAFLLGFCALLLIVLWLFQTVFLDSFYKKIKVTEIRRNAAVIINNIERENIGEIIADISDNNNISVSIADPDGKSLPVNLPGSPPRISPPDNRRRLEENAALIAKARNNGGEIYEYITPSAEDRPRNNTESDRTENTRTVNRRRFPIQSLIYVKMANNKSGGQFAVIIRAIISPVNATVTTLRYQLYYISCIILFFSVILAFIIAKRVSKPIEEISRSAMGLANGNYDTRFTGKGFYEIVALSDTLNTAALELSRVESLRRELLANVSHDLRTPLALIYSYAEMMRDFPGEITQEQTQTIMDETRRLTTLVNDILDISKLENEMDKLNITRFNLTQSISETAKITEKLLKKEEFEITFSHNGDVYADADKAKIDRAFYNLLINAINYSGGNRNILVEQSVTGNRVRISVIDYGEGIAEADLPFIWDRYYKSGKTHKRAVTGSGLGLSIVKKIIDIHGGKYGVVSEPGKGSTFWFEIGLPG